MVGKGPIKFQIETFHFSQAAYLSFIFFIFQSKILTIIITIIIFCFRFIGWKGLFPSAMLSDPVIKTNFNRGLSLMDHAAAGTLVPGMKENMAYFITSERYKCLFTVEILDCTVTICTVLWLCIAS